MPHINHRRGDHRRRSKQCNQRYQTDLGWWNRQASRKHRAIEARILARFQALGCDLEVADSLEFPSYRRVDDLWFYD